MMKWRLSWNKFTCWARLDRPWRMYADNRKQDPLFLATELLYLRILDAGYSELLPTGSYQPQQLVQTLIEENCHLPDQSVNRGKHSKPNDVLFPRNTRLGIVCFPSSYASKVIQSKAIPPAQFTFQPTHTPNKCNYSHSEIYVFKNNQRHNKKVPNLVKQEYREGLVGAETQLIKMPSPNEGFAWIKRRCECMKQKIG
jgi:hypothetical protein